MSVERKLKDALRFLKMDGNIAAAARRADIPERTIRYRVANQPEWKRAVDLGERRRKLEEKKEAEREYARHQNLVGTRRAERDRFRRELFAKVGDLARDDIEKQLDELAKLEAKLHDAQREAFHAKQEYDQKCRVNS